ncbi:MAG: Ribosome-releasing factor 2, mitochondrial [Alyxoria varia]|nr:MAG: Ribosome-releasing factor 2, mitochondrial [Alyxoria varia]
MKDVDDGSTVTDFLPAERARGITIQSAAITFHWPPKADPKDSGPQKGPESRVPCTINLIDTPGHADFTFEVIRSLRILDGAVTILDGVAGVEAQTEKVWHQASAYHIPRIIFVNKLDRDGAAFGNTVKEVASRLHTWPVVCQMPWYKNEKLIGIGDVVEYCGLDWSNSVDGSTFEKISAADLGSVEPELANEMLKARTALIEALTEYDDQLVDEFINASESFEALSAQSIRQAIRRVLQSHQQKITPTFCGASFRNIGVQPLLDAVDDLLSCPAETADPAISLGGNKTSLRRFIQNGEAGKSTHQPSQPKSKSAKETTSNAAGANLSACALAFKVVSDARLGTLVYVRVYSGSISRNTLLFNTNLSASERAMRLLRMYASQSTETETLSVGEIGVIVGLKHARTGDTLVSYIGASAKNRPPAPFNSLQLQPIDVPPPLFFASIEPTSLSEEKNMHEGLSLLLREDPSLSVQNDEDSGQTWLAGMGELHLEIARDRLIDHFKVKARMGKIAISYREAMSCASKPLTRTFDRDIAGKRAAASCTTDVKSIAAETQDCQSTKHTHFVQLSDYNAFRIHHPTLSSNGKPASLDVPGLPPDLSMNTLIDSLISGATGALCRGPSHGLPVHSTSVTIHFDPASHILPNTTPAALTSAARLAITAAMRESATDKEVALMEPVMLATIAVNEESMGSVVHDLSSSRGAQVLSLDAESDQQSAGSNVASENASSNEPLTSAQLERVYTPPDLYGNSSSGRSVSASGAQQRTRQIRARVPLREMVGYLKHLRSLTGGRGSFVMSVEGFEKVTGQKIKKILNDLRGDFE